MKTKKHSLFIFAFGFLAAMICMFACLSTPKTDAFAEGTAPASDAVVLINVGENANVTLDTSNPNGVTTEGIVWKGLGVSEWDVANKAECFANIGNENNKKVALLLKFVKPIEAKYFDDFSFKFFPGNTGTLYVYDSAAKDFTAEAAKGSLKVKGFAENTIKLNAADFAADDGFVKEITLFCDRDDTTDWFFGKFTFSLKEEYVPLPEDFEMEATEDPTTSPITGAALVLDGETVVSRENANVNGIKEAFEFVSFKENTEYMKDECGYNTENVGSMSAMLFKLKNPVTAADYDTLSLSFFPGFSGTVALYSSEAKIFNGVTAAGIQSVTAYKKCTVTAKASALANAEGKIENITLAVIESTTGQFFFYGIDLGKADGTTDKINFLERNGIVTCDTTNPNGVNLKPYTFINAKKQTWSGAGMGLCSELMFDEAGSTMVISFKDPINTALYEKIEFTIFSGMTGTLEIYSSTAKALFSGNAVQTEEIKSQGKYTFTMITADYADADGMMSNFTLYAPRKSDEKGQIFFGKMKATAKTQTSYLDELVLTEGGKRSITLGENAEFISENIPAATGETGAFSDKTAVKVTGKTTFTYLKKMVWNDTHYGNIHMRLYLPEGSDVTKINFTAEGSEAVTYVANVAGKNGWFDVVLSVTDFLNEEGTIGSMTIEADGNKGFIFGGAKVEDKLRILAEKTTEADISELVPMSKDGFNFVSEGKVNYQPLFERKDMDKNVVKFRMKISDLTADFNVMIELAGKGPQTDGIWFWFDKTSINMVTGARVALPADIVSNEYFEVELGTVPYSVDFMPYGVKGYVKINGKLVLETNVDASVQETGKYFGVYVHQTAENVSVSIAPVNYVETKTVELTTESGKIQLKKGDTDKIIVKRNMEFEGREISAVEVVSGESITLDEDGYITAVKKGSTVLKVTVSAAGVLASEEITLTIEVNEYHTVRIGNNTQQVSDGEKLVLPELTAPQDGYEFAGLFTDKECTQKFDYENTPITADVTLYVGWQQKQTKKKGCFGEIGGFATALGVAILGVAVIILRKKEQKI